MLGKALTTEACTKQKAESMLAKTGTEKGGCLLRQFYTMCFRVGLLDK